LTLVRLEISPFSNVVAEIIQERSSGSLTVLRHTRRWEIFWAVGDLAMIVANDPAQSFWQFLIARNAATPDQLSKVIETPPLEIVPAFQSLGLYDSTRRQSLLRDWLRALITPMFGFDEGTAAFTPDEAIDPAFRILLQSTAPYVVEGVRSIENGLVVRKSLGDMTRVIGIDHQAIPLESLPLTDQEMSIAASLDTPQRIDTFLKAHSADSLASARTVIMLMTLGVFQEQTEAPTMQPLPASDPQRDLELLAAIGANDPRSLKAIGLARNLQNMDFYRFLDMAHGATSAQLVERIEWMRREYDPASFPPAARDYVKQIAAMLDRDMATLSNPQGRQEYDRLLARGHSPEALVQQAVRRNISTQNFRKARDLSIMGDYYGAIVLLKQTVNYDSGNAEAWLLLGNCQEKNPKWRREAANSYHKALAANPNNVDALISLGDLYRSEGLAARAQTFYEDVLKIEPEHPIAKKRLDGSK
jgi:hypothetical protein